MKRILLICIAALWTTAFAQAEDGWSDDDVAELVKFGAVEGVCTTLVDLIEFTMKDTRHETLVFVSLFIRQFLDKYHNTPTTLWETCASIDDDYADAIKRLGIKEDRT